MPSVVIALWAIGLITRKPALLGYDIPLPAAVLAFLTIISSIVGYFVRAKNLRSFISLTAYLCLLATGLALIISTGRENSPFIALWMLVSIFAGLFGLQALIPAFVSVSVYLAYLITAKDVTTEQLITFCLAFYLPLVVSYFIWHSRTKEDTEHDTAFSALAQELSQVANKSEIVINAIADGVIAIDEKSVVQLINPAAQSIIGWGKQDALKLDYHSIFKLIDDKEVALSAAADPIQQCLRTHQVTSSSNLWLETISGKRIVVSVKVSPLSSKGEGAIVVFRDITAEQAEERQQAEFISTASHEMRTPVAAIEGYIGLALNPQTATIDAKAREYLERAHDSAQNLGRLFQDLLDVSKAEDGRLKNNPTLIDTIASVRSFTESFEPAAAAKHLQLKFLPDIMNRSSQRVSPVFYSMLDVDHLREILSNLIENAIKYTPEGHIEVDVQGNENHVLISVSDTGIGIPPEDIPHLFQKFYRVDNSDTREIGGTGLGLYLCRRLTEAMGGRLELKSDFGKGSSFILEFDRVRQDEAMSYIEAHSKKPVAVPTTTKAL